MLAYARIGRFYFVLVGGCVLAMFPFPATTGPFSTVNGPAAEMRSAHNGLLFLGIVFSALRKAARVFAKSCCAPTSSVPCQISFEFPRILNC